MYAEARSEYTRAAAMGSVAAMVNLGNLAVMSRDFSSAEEWFKKALQAEPGNRSALSGLDQILGRRLD
jgi:TPR repeat protein